MNRLLLPVAALLLACPAASSKTAEAKPADAAAASAPEVPMLDQRGKVTVRTQDGREWQLDVEIASNDPDRARGLMWRRKMPEMAGMYFAFAEEEHHQFWMKNTLLPLDMLFIGADDRVVGIVENAEPQTTTGRAVPGVSRYVLEVNGGWCARHGVRAGDTVKLEGMYDLR